jgi:hypothetical protein
MSADIEMYVHVNGKNMRCKKTTRIQKEYMQQLEQEYADAEHRHNAVTLRLAGELSKTKAKTQQEMTEAEAKYQAKHIHTHTHMHTRAGRQAGRQTARYNTHTHTHKCPKILM